MWCVARSKAPTVVYTCSHAVMQQLWFIEIWLFMEIRPGTFSTSNLIFFFFFLQNFNHWYVQGSISHIPL